MSRKIAIAVFPAVLFIAWFLYRHYVPLDVADSLASMQDTHDWVTYSNARYGFEMKYPSNYFACQSGSNAVSFRQNTASTKECRTLGKRIGVQVFELGRSMRFGIGSHYIQVTKDTTLDDISSQFLANNNRPLVQHACHQKNINGNKAMICTIRAPGEMPSISGGIFGVIVFGIYDTANGKRVLVKIVNDAGATPHNGDRELQRDTLGMFQSLRWLSNTNGIKGKSRVINNQGE